MRRAALRILLIPVLCTMFACPGYAQSERTHVTDLSRALDPGATLEVDNLVGAITATQAPGTTATIVARAHSRDGDPASVRVVATQTAAGLVVCTLYPGDARTSCGSGANHRGESEHDDIVVDFTIGVPRGHRFVGSSVSGSVAATGLSDEADVHSVEGSLRLQTTGAGSAHTVSGSITASIGELPRSGEFGFTSVNGSIDLTLPRATNAVLEARTMNGRITIDGVFRVPPSSTFVGASEHGTIGSGGATLKLDTLNGSIQVRGA